MRPRSANEWRDFWRDGGERRLGELLGSVWEPRGGEYATRVSMLLGSGAPVRSLAAELGRIRVQELGAGADPDADLRAAEQIHAWFSAG